MHDKAILFRLLDRITNKPLLIHPAKRDAILDVIGGRVGLDVSGLDLGRLEQGVTAPKPEMRATNVEHGGDRTVTLAIIPVHGTLVHRAGGLDAMSGLRSYTAIRQDFRAAMDDSTVNGIILDVDSYGGEVDGCFDLVDEIFEARGIKDVYAIVNDNGYSAGYAIASAAREIFITQTGGLGSIGVRSLHIDRSARNEAEGLKFTEEFVGDRKNDFSPNQPLTDEAKKVWRASLNKTYDIFTAVVARNRNMKEEAVRATEAGFFEGEDAVQAGLADAVLSREQAIERIASNISTGGVFMSDEKGSALQRQLGALMKGSSDTENAEALAGLGYVPASAQVDEEAVRKEARQQGVDDTLALVANMHKLCEVGGVPQLTAALVADGVSLEEAGPRIIDARAELEKAGDINSTVGAITTGAINPLMADAQARADSHKTK